MEGVDQDYGADYDDGQDNFEQEMLGDEGGWGGQQSRMGGRTGGGQGSKRRREPDHCILIRSRSEQAV